MNTPNHSAILGFVLKTSTQNQSKIHTNNHCFTIL